MTDFSVINVNYNIYQRLLNGLPSVAEITIGMPSEIWVEDNASFVGSVDGIQSAFPEVHLVSNYTNLGYARVNNQILAQTRSNILVLLNPGTAVLPSAFTSLKQASESDSATGEVGPQVPNSDG